MDTDESKKDVIHSQTKHSAQVVHLSCLWAQDLCHIGCLHLPGILSTLRLFYRGKTDPKFLADASFLCDEAPVTFAKLRNMIKRTSCTVGDTTLVIFACVQSTVVDTSFKMSALHNNPEKLAYLFNNHKNCKDEVKSEFEAGSISVYSTFFLNSFVPITSGELCWRCTQKCSKIVIKTVWCNINWNGLHNFL